MRGARKRRGRAMRINGTRMRTMTMVTYGIIALGVGGVYWRVDEG